MEKTPGGKFLEESLLGSSRKAVVLVKTGEFSFENGLNCSFSFVIMLKEL